MDPQNTASDLDNALTQVVTEQMRADAAEKERDAEKARADKLAGEVAGLQTQIDALKKERADNVDAEKVQRQVKALERAFQAEKKARTDAENPERIRTLVKARVDLERKAATVIPDARFDEMSDRDIRIAVIERLDGKVDANATDGFVDGCFNTLIRGHAAGAAAIARVREITETRTDEKAREQRSDARTEREKFLAKQSNAWKGN